MNPPPIDVFVARQPIFDAARRVTGYELLYRSGETNAVVGPRDADAMSAENLERSLLGFGLDALTGDRDAWVNVSRHMLLHDHWSMLPASHTVLELLEDVRPVPEVVAACARAKDAGYRLALDDFVYEPAFEPLLALADWVKVDFRAGDAARRRELARTLRRGRAGLVAEKIESEAEFDEAAGLGYALYQGYFFCRPQMMRARVMAPHRVGFLRLLREVHERELDFDAIEGLIEQDLALSVKLLRFLRSAAFGLGREVSSIRQGLMTLGERLLRKWVSLVAVVGLADGKPSELVVVALARARFAERLAERAGLGERSTDLFLTGLLSVVDALTDQPLETAVAGLGLAADVREALLRGGPPLGDVLHLVLAWERGHWDEAERWLRRLGISEADASRDYTEAVLWAEDHAQP